MQRKIAWLAPDNRATVPTSTAGNVALPRASQYESKKVEPRFISPQPIVSFPFPSHATPNKQPTNQPDPRPRRDETRSVGGSVGGLNRCQERFVRWPSPDTKDPSCHDTHTPFYVGWLRSSLVKLRSSCEDSISGSNTAAARKWKRSSQTRPRPSCPRPRRGEGERPGDRTSRACPADDGSGEPRRNLQRCWIKVIVIIIIIISQKDHSRYEP